MCNNASLFTIELGPVHAGAPVDTFIGNGLLGQRVIVVPSQELVIVRLGLNFNNDFDQVVMDTLSPFTYVISEKMSGFPGQVEVSGCCYNMDFMLQWTEM